MRPRPIAVLLSLSACLAAGAFLGTPGSRAAAQEPSKPSAGKKPDSPAPPAPPAPAPSPVPDSNAPTASPPDKGPPEIKGPARQLEEVPDLFAPTPVKGPDDPVTEFSIESLETYVTFFPARSTRIGVRTLDTDLGDYRKVSVDAFVGSNKGYLQRIEKIPTDGLTEKGRLELESLRVHFRSVLRLVDTLGAPQRDPNFYVDESVGAINESLEHDESKPMEMAGHVLARLSIIPSFLEIARQNLGTCSRPAVRRAIIRLRASSPIFVTHVPALFQGSGHPIAGKTGPQASAAAWKAISGFADWLEKEKLPTGTDAAPLGDAGWHAWLLSREDMDLDPARVIAVAEADLGRLEDELKRETSRLEPDKTAAALIGEIAAERYEPEIARRDAEGKIIPGLWEWMIHERPLSPPSAQVIEVRETPAQRRRDAPLSTNLPGGFATPDAPAFLEIAAPDPDWPQARMLSWLSAYGRSFIKGALAREVYPGRFVLWERSRVATTRANRTLDFPIMSGGWGLYAEELALRRGYAPNEPKVRIAMLVDLVRADLRLIAQVRMHTKAMPRQAAAEYLKSRGYWSRPEADEETERLLVDPDAAAPALGRLALLALREDVKKAQGAKFVDIEFHDRLTSFGTAPISALRRVMLPQGPGGLLGSAK